MLPNKYINMCTSLYTHTLADPQLLADTESIILALKCQSFECTQHCPHIFNLVLFGKHICVWVHVIFCEKFNGRGSSTETNFFWSQMSLLSTLRGGACKELIELLHFHIHEQTLLFG